MTDHAGPQKAPAPADCPEALASSSVPTSGPRPALTGCAAAPADDVDEDTDDTE